MNKRSIELARAQRANATQSETIAWELLRGRRLLGFKFYRERPRGRHRADFYCAELRLCIEIDGGIHDDPVQAARDQERDRHLATRGVSVVRVRAEDVCQTTLERCVRAIAAARTLR